MITYLSVLDPGVLDVHAVQFRGDLGVSLLSPLDSIIW
jgi:hypothetical protein